MLPAIQKGPPGMGDALGRRRVLGHVYKFHLGAVGLIQSGEC